MITILLTRRKKKSPDWSS